MQSTAEARRRGARALPVAPTLLAALFLASATACGEADRHGSDPAADTAIPPAPAPDTATAPEPAAPTSDLRGYDTVFVYFDEPASEGGEMGPRVPRPRAVPAETDALSMALEELLKGPTRADEATGPLYSWFSGETAGMLRRVTLTDGFAVVEFEDLRPVIPNASTSAGSTMLLGQLEATVFQFPEVRRVEFRIDGSCEAFMAWLQRGCVPLPRSDFTPPPGYRRAVPE
ncbi:MAG: GerMN domain-containing protein [Longimicrobiales bacterium]